ncbi:hypothetical protein ACQ1Z5_14270, partial [Enterococcus faecalis]|uniref:hypothetical protein n=1 Tax=Enterococcus faecalis TaxID=1351 RepID=UPI003D6AF889
HNYSDPEIVELLTTGFTESLHSWWDRYLTPVMKEEIKQAHQLDEQGTLVHQLNDFGNVQMIPDGVNTLIFTIIKHFVGTPSNIHSRIHDQL